MTDIWNFFLAHWMIIFWVIIAAAVLSAAIAVGIDEILFRIERRRYQRANE